MIPGWPYSSVAALETGGIHYSTQQMPKQS